MIHTSVTVKTGRDFVNFFYNVSEGLRPTKTECNAVGKIEVEVFVDGMMFYSEEFRFCGASPVKPFGKVTIKDLGESEYTYRIRETLVHISSSRYGREGVATNELNGSFTISEEPVHLECKVPHISGLTTCRT